MADSNEIKTNINDSDSEDIQRIEIIAKLNRLIKKRDQKKFKVIDKIKTKPENETIIFNSLCDQMKYIPNYKTNKNTNNERSIRETESEPKNIKDFSFKYTYPIDKDKEKLDLNNLEINNQDKFNLNIKGQLNSPQEVTNKSNSQIILIDPIFGLDQKIKEYNFQLNCNKFEWEKNKISLNYIENSKIITNNQEKRLKPKLANEENFYFKEYLLQDKNKNKIIKNEKKIETQKKNIYFNDKINIDITKYKEQQEVFGMYQNSNNKLERKFQKLIKKILRPTKVKKPKKTSVERKSKILAEKIYNKNIGKIRKKGMEIKDKNQKKDLKKFIKKSKIGDNNFTSQKNLLLKNKIYNSEKQQINNKNFSGNQRKKKKVHVFNKIFTGNKNKRIDIIPLPDLNNPKHEYLENDSEIQITEKFSTVSSLNYNELMIKKKKVKINETFALERKKNIKKLKSKKVQKKNLDLLINKDELLNKNGFINKDRLLTKDEIMNEEKLLICKLDQFQKTINDISVVFDLKNEIAQELFLKSNFSIITFLQTIINKNN